MRESLCEISERIDGQVGWSKDSAQGMGTVKRRPREDTDSQGGKENGQVGTRPGGPSSRVAYMWGFNDSVVMGAWLVMRGCGRGNRGNNIGAGLI